MAVITQTMPQLLATVKGVPNTPVVNSTGFRPRIGDTAIVFSPQGSTTWYVAEIQTGEIPIGRIYFNRAKTGDPSHFASVLPDGTGFAVEQWSKNPTKHRWWFKLSPDRRRILYCECDVADISGLLYHDPTKLRVCIANADGTNPRTVIDKPANITNPDGSSVTGHATPNWYDNETFVMFRGPARSGGANAALRFDVDGNFIDVISDIAAVGITDTQVFSRDAPFNLPIFVTGVDTNVRTITATTTNGNTSLTSSGAGNAFSANDAGRFILGPGISPGTYIASVTNSTTAVLSANSGAAAGTGMCLLYPEATSITSVGSAYLGNPRMVSIVGANQEVFGYPVGQTHEEGVGSLPKSFYQYTQNTTSELTDFDPNPDPSGEILSMLTRVDGATLTGNMTNSQNTIPMSHRDNYPQSGSFDVLIGAERMTVAGGQGTGAGNFTSVTRGVGGTTATTHSTGDHVYIYPAGQFGVCGMRIDDGPSGSGTKARMWIGVSTFDRGAPDITDGVGNYCSKFHFEPRRAANGKAQGAFHRFVNNKQSYDTGTPASYVGIYTIDIDRRTLVASNAKTVWADDHVSEFPFWT